MIQDFPGLRSILGGTDDPLRGHLLDQSGCPGVTDSQAPLEHGDRSSVFISDQLDSLIPERIPVRFFCHVLPHLFLLKGDGWHFSVWFAGWSGPGKWGFDLSG